MNNNYQNDNQSNNSQNQATNPEPSGIMKMVGQSLPFLPLLFEQFTGQKIPQMSGTMAEIQMVLINIQTSLQAIVQNQQALDRRLTALENNATNQFTNLIQQIQSIKTIRLSHSK